MPGETCTGGRVGGQGRRELDIAPAAVTQFRERVSDSGRCVIHTPGLHAGLHEGSGEVTVGDRKLRQRPLGPADKVRVVERAPEYEPGNGIQVGGEGLAAEAHRFERDRAPSGEGIEDAGCAAVERIADSFPETVEFETILSPPMEDTPVGFLEVRVFASALESLRDQTAGHVLAEASTAFGIARVGQQRGEEHCSARGEGSSGWPYVECGDMAMADVFLVDRIQGDLAEGEGGFAEAGTVAAGRHQAPFRAARAADSTESRHLPSR